MKKKRPQDQTNEEWLQGYKGDSPNPDIKLKSISHDGSTVASLHRIKSQSSPPIVFKFLDFRTTRKNSVAMDFINIDGTVKATAYFGVKLENSQGEKYKVGARGQFIPSRGGKFYTFWMNTVGEEPFRLCRVHKSMRSKLKGKLFTGKISSETDRNRNHYFKLRDLTLIEQAQTRHELGTNSGHTLYPQTVAISALQSISTPQHIYSTVPQHHS